MPKFGKEEEFTGYDGSDVWKELHSTVDRIECAFCRAKAIRLLRGLHDSVNTHLGKPVKFMKDLKFLHQHVFWSLKQHDHGMRCSNCQ